MAMSPEERKKLLDMLNADSDIERAPTALPQPKNSENYTDEDADRDQKEFSGQEAMQDEPETEDGLPAEIADSEPQQGSVQDSKEDDDAEDDPHLELNDESAMEDENDDSAKDLAERINIDKDGNPVAKSNIAEAPTTELTPEEAAISGQARTPASGDDSKTSDKNNYYSDLMSRFLAAQKEAGLNKDMNDAGKYAYAAATGFRGVQSNPNITNTMEEAGKRADQPVQNLVQQLQIEGQDPNSESAQAMRNAYATALNLDPSKLQNMNVDQMEKTFKFLGDNANNKIKALAAKQKAQNDTMKVENAAKALDQKQPLIDSQIKQNNSKASYLDQKPDLDKAKMQMMKDQKEKQASDKTTKQQNDSMSKATALLESARGTPAVAQAEKDIYAASKANSLANLYGDPNKLSPAQVTMLATEVSKIASGGVPSMHELDAISPSTLQGKLAGVWSRLSNDPTPANAGAFIKQYQDYAKALTADAQKVIKDKYGRVIDTYKNQVGPDNAAVLDSKYNHRFDDAVPPSNTKNYDGSAPLPQNASDSDKQARIAYLKQKAGQ